MATKSIGSSGRDYATLALWAAYVNALSLSAPEIGECYNDSEFTSATKITFGGWTGDSGTNTVTLKCAAGQSFRDNANVLTNALRYNQANGVGFSSSRDYDTAISITGGHFIIDGLQIKTTNSDSQGWIVMATGTDNFTLKNTIVQANSLRNSTYNGILIRGSGSSITNCLVLKTGSNAGTCILPVSAGNITDVTIVNSNGTAGVGLDCSYSSGTVVKNVAEAGNVTDYTGTCSASSSNNATDKGSFGGTNFGGSGQTNLVGSTEWQSVTAGSEDLRLKSTSAKLKNNGATAGPANDIAGTARPQGASYDIGCWELVATGGGLRRNSSLSGLGASGPFFHDPLAA